MLFPSAAAPLASAALITPCGVSHTWRTRSLTAPGLATGCAPPSDQAYLPLAATASRGVLALRADNFHLHGGRLIIDGDHVRFCVKTRPFLAGSERLAEG